MATPVQTAPQAKPATSNPLEKLSAAALDHLNGSASSGVVSKPITSGGASKPLSSLVTASAAESISVAPIVNSEPVNRLQNYMEWIKNYVFQGARAPQLPRLSTHGGKFELAEPNKVEHFACQKCRQFPRDPILCTPITNVHESIRLLCETCSGQSSTALLSDVMIPKSVHSCVRHVMSATSVRCLACESSMMVGLNGQGVLLHVEQHCPNLLQCICKQQFSLKAFEAHYAECSNKEVACPFSTERCQQVAFPSTGCTWKGPGLQRSEHILICPVKTAMIEYIISHPVTPVACADPTRVVASPASSASSVERTTRSLTSVARPSLKRPAAVALPEVQKSESIEEEDEEEVEEVPVSAPAEPATASSRPAKKPAIAANPTRYRGVKALNDTHVHMLVHNGVILRMKLMRNEEGEATRLFVVLKDLARWIVSHKIPGLSMFKIQDWVDRENYSESTDWGNVLLQHCRLRSGAHDEPEAREGSLVQVIDRQYTNASGTSRKFKCTVEIDSNSSVTKVVSERVVDGIYAHLVSTYASVSLAQPLDTGVKSCIQYLSNTVKPVLRLTHFAAALKEQLVLVIMRSNLEKAREQCVQCQQRVDSAKCYTCSDQHCEGKYHRACLDKALIVAPPTMSWQCPDCCDSKL